MNIGWIGTGVMGLSMGGHLLAAGHELTVFNRTQRKAQPLLAKGARWADSPRVVAEQTAIVFTMVGFPADVREVYFGSAGVLSAGPAPAQPSLCVDMTTTAPTLAQEIYEAAKAKGIAALDAPVSGGDVGARNATLSIMVGGDPAAVAQALPLFQLLGQTIVHQGGPGAGQHAKLSNQIVIAGTIIGVCEALLYGAEAGLDLETMLRSIRPGAAACWTLENLAPRILQRNFEPGFYVAHFLKDLNLALDESRRLGLRLRGVALAQELYDRTQTLGYGKKGTQALYLALESLAPGMTLTLTQWLLGALAAILVGFSKTGVPGMGILMVPLMALVFPAKESVGVLLPLLVVGDLFAVGFYRRHAQWNKLWNLFPAVALGMVVAAWCLRHIDDQQMKPILGWLVLALIALDFVRQAAGWHDVPHHPAFIMTMGFLGGFGSTMGNVAGPIMTIYFLARGLERDAFIGTFAWFFLIVNVSKLPIYVWADMLHPSGLVFDLWMVPLVTLGALVGKWTLPRIPEKTFNWLVLLLAALTAVKLVWR